MATAHLSLHKRASLLWWYDILWNLNHCASIHMYYYHFVFTCILQFNFEYTSWTLVLSHLTFWDVFMLTPHNKILWNYETVLWNYELYGYSSFVSPQKSKSTLVAWHFMKLFTWNKSQLEDRRKERYASLQ